MATRKMTMVHHFMEKLYFFFSILTILFKELAILVTKSKIIKNKRKQLYYTFSYLWANKKVKFNSGNTLNFMFTCRVLLPSVLFNPNKSNPSNDIYQNFKYFLSLLLELKSLFPVNDNTWTKLDQQIVSSAQSPLSQIKILRHPISVSIVALAN